MEITNWLSILGGGLIQNLVPLLVILAGLTFCVFNLKRFPKASRTALPGLIILLAAQLAGVFLPAIFTQLMLTYRNDVSSLGLVNMLIGFIHSLISAVGLGLVIFAVWNGRNSE